MTELHEDTIRCPTCNGKGEVIIVSLGELLRITRQSRGMATREAGREIGISAATISRLECGKGFPDLPSAFKVSKWCGLTGCQLAAIYS